MRRGLAARVGLAVMVAAGIVAAAHVARADTPLELRWVAPAGCPTADDVRAEFARLVRVPADAAAPALSADARLEARGGRFVLRLHTVRDGREGEREIEAESCASLARAAALVLVLAYGQTPEPADAPATAPRAPAPRPRAAPPPTPVVETPPKAAPPAPEPPPPPAVIVRVAPPPLPPAQVPVWSIAVEAGVGSPFPGPGPRVGLGLDRAAGRFAGTLRLEGWTPTDRATSVTGVGVRYEGVGASLGACAIPVRTSRVAGLACLAGGLAALRGASTGAPANGAATAPWTTVAPSLRARVRLLGRVYLDARVEAKLSLERPRFAVDNLGDVAEVPRVVPAAILGLSLDL